MISFLNRTHSVESKLSLHSVHASWQSSLSPLSTTLMMFMMSLCGCSTRQVYPRAASIVRSASIMSPWSCLYLADVGSSAGAEASDSPSCKLVTRSYTRRIFVVLV